METDYNRPEDLAADDSFINYCFHNNKEDTASWEQWLAGHPDKERVVEKARHLVFLMSVKLPPEKKDREWEKVKAGLEEGYWTVPHKRRNSQVRWLTAGISLLLVIGIAAFYWSMQDLSFGRKRATARTESYTTFPGQRHSIVLNDGTRVWLNADSRLTCSDDFNTGDTRNVTLAGEAYFEVASDAARPFIIHTKKLDIRVLGTIFNVKAYPRDKTAEADLISGSIEVSLNQHPSRKIILRPHEKIIVYNRDVQLKSMTAAAKKISVPDDSIGKFTVAPLNKDPLLDSGIVETAWMEGKLVFRNESFEQLARQMGRQYDVHFHFANDDLKAYRFTGIFSTETIGQALHALQLTSPSDPFNYKVEGKEVLITQAENGK